MDAAHREYNTATTHGAAGRYQNAVPHLEKAVAICEVKGQVNSAFFVDSLTKLGFYCMHLSDCARAVTLLQRAQAVARGLDHTDDEVARQHMLGIALKSSGRATEATIAFESSLALSEQAHDKQGVIAALTTLSGQRQLTGQNDLAASLLQRAELLCTETPDDSVKYARQRCFIITQTGRLQSFDGRFADALASFRAALALNIELNGKCSDLVANGHTDVGIALMELGQHDAAADSFASACGVYELLGQRESANYGTLLFNIGRNWSSQGKSAEALDAMKQCLAVQRRVLPPDHPNLGDVLQCIAKLSAALGSSTVAAEAAKEASSVHRRSQTLCAG